MEVLQHKDLQYLSISAIIGEAVHIPRYSPRTFAFLTLTLIFPLSFAILAHPLLTHPLLLRLDAASPSAASDVSLLVFYQFSYLVFLFVFSLLSTAAVVFSVASLHAGKPLFFHIALSAVVPIFPRLFLTFLWTSLLLLLYNLSFVAAVLLLVSLFDGPDVSGTPAFLLAVFALLLFFLLAHVYISALWHLASVASVLEPIQGFAAMRKAHELLRGKTIDACVLVAAYLGACGGIGTLFRAIVVYDGEDEEEEMAVGIWPRVLMGAFLVAVLVVVNLVGLLVQSVFYYVCKSFHHQEIDKRLLSEHLGGYLGEYMPLKSAIQMETFNF